MQSCNHCGPVPHAVRQDAASGGKCIIYPRNTLLLVLPANKVTISRRVIAQWPPCPRSELNDSTRMPWSDNWISPLDSGKSCHRSTCFLAQLGTRNLLPGSLEAALGIQHNGPWELGHAALPHTVKPWSLCLNRPVLPELWIIFPSQNKICGGGQRSAPLACYTISTNTPYCNTESWALVQVSLAYSPSKNCNGIREQVAGQLASPNRKLYGFDVL
ncbi:hypothetical protein V8F20_010055 [Naviculisporaceae sp. PSN 640]